MAETTSDIQRIDTEVALKASLVGGVVPTAQLGSGTANSSSFLRGDQTWQALAGGGDVVGDDTSTTVQNIVAYSTTGGKNLTELTGTQGDVLYHNGTNWAKLGAGTSGDVLKTQGAAANPTWASVIFPKGHIYGLTMSNAADAVNDITVAAGEVLSDDGTTNMVLAAAITKQIDAGWAVGTNAGGMNTGAVADTTWYEVHVIKRTDTNVVDVMFTTTANRATLPASYTKKRRIGWVRRGAATNLAFVQVDDHFTLVTPVNDVSAIASAAAVSRTLTVPPSTIARFRAAALGNTSVNAANAVVISELVETDTAPTTTNGFNSIGAGDFAIIGACHIEIRVNSSSQVRDRSITATGSMAYDISTYGWIDHRGRMSDT